MFWILVALPFVSGLLLGASTQTRFGVLVLPPVAIAFVYWVAVGWNGHDYEMGRSGAVLFTGIFGLAFVSVWLVGSAVGRIVRLGFAR